MTFLLGLIYPSLVTLIGQLGFPRLANGSLIEKDGKLVGSDLIAQKFESEKYFWPRPSAVDFNPLPSGGSNLGPTSASLKDAVESRRLKLGSKAPLDLLFTSASGLDPHISPEAAFYQIPRVAKARGVSESELKGQVIRLLERRQFGFLGEDRVNVLKLNLALDKKQ